MPNLSDFNGVASAVYFNHTGVDVLASQDTEEWCEEKFSRPVLEQREAERSAYRL
jgi:hypothetical protein